MDKRQLKVLLNIGRDDEKRYNIPLAKEDDIVSVSEEQAHTMVNVLRVAKDYNAKEEEKHRQRIAEFDQQVIEKEVQEMQSRLDVEAAARQRLEEAKARVAGRATRGVRSEAVQADAPKK